MTINKELLKGSTSLMILALLESKDMYGYEMIKEIEQRSEDVFTFKEGTLYPLLHGMENEQLITAYWEESSSQRKRKYYQITAKGKVIATEKKQEWQTFNQAVNNILGGALIGQN